MDNYKTLQFKAGKIIFSEKMACEGLYIIKSGQIEIFKWAAGRNGQIPLGIVGPGEYLGESALFMNQPHSSNAIAISDVEVLFLKKDAIDEQLKAGPPWLVALIRGLIMKLQKTNEVVRRNALVDETLANTVNAIGENHRRGKKPA